MELSHTHHRQGSLTMSISNHGRFRQQVRFLRRQFLQDGELPFTDVLSEGTVTQALTALSVVWLDRVYSPLVTLWIFLAQVLSQDHSCRAAVARLVAHRVARGQRPCSAETGAYCQARKRLPENFFSEVARRAGRSLDDGVDPRWLWKRRRVYVYDGSAVSMPDTPEYQADYRRGRRLGPGDHVVEWLKPQKPRTIDRGTYDSLPERLTVRETRVRVEQAGFRSRVIIVVTTLLDADAIAADDLAQLYRARWNAELDLRSLKRTLQMDVLRCKTPDLVRKELWTHVLADNLIRTIIAQAARKEGIEPRSISFKGAAQTLAAFQPIIAIQGNRDPSFHWSLY